MGLERLKPYVLHLRPRGWLFVAGHMTVGYLLSMPPSEWLGSWPRWLFGAILWVPLFNGGTLALNSAFDHDTGDIGYLPSPPPVPKYLWQFGLALMLLGGLFAFAISMPFAIVYAACIVMSVAYSCPPVRLKARAGVDLVVNLLGYGALSVFQGWAIARDDVSPFIVSVCAGYALLYAGFYPLTQAYQHDEDVARGDRTFMVALGLSRSLYFSLVLTLCGFAAFLCVALSRRACAWLLLPALLAWLLVLIPWIRRGQAYPAKRGFYRAFKAAIATDVFVVATFVAW